MPLPKNAKNDVLQREERRKKVADLYLANWPQFRIAKHLGCGVATVCEDLAAVRKEWLASRVMAFDERTAQELAKLDRVEEEAWKSFELSKRPRLKPVVSKKGKSEPARKLTEADRGPGDKEWLDVVTGCVDRRSKLLGLVKEDKGKGEKEGRPVIVIQSPTGDVKVGLFEALGGGGADGFVDPFEEATNPRPVKAIGGSEGA